MAGNRFSVVAGLILLLAAALQASAQPTPPPAAPPPTPADIIQNAPVSALKYAGVIEAQGSGFGGGLGNLTSDLFTGGVHYQVVLPVPATPGFQPPAPSVVYSARGELGIAGLGWTADFGMLQSSKLHASDAPTIHHVTASGTIALVQLPSGRYASETASPINEYIQPNSPTGGWEMRDEHGARFFFGETAESREPSTGDTKVWRLTRAIDPNGNFFVVTYARAGDSSIVQSVEYGGHQKAGNVDVVPYIKYAYGYEARPDTVTRFGNGYFSTLDSRLNSITLSVNANVQRTYRFTYGLSPTTSQSLLKEVDEAAATGASRTVAKFDYNVGEIGFADGELAVPANAAHSDQLRWTGVAGAQAQLIDLLGGDRPQYCTPETNTITCRALDKAFSAVKATVPDRAIASDWGDLSASFIRPVDLNNDGLIDLCLMQSNGISCWMNEGGRFKHAIGGPGWPISDEISVGSLRFGDVNGDSFPDLCRVGSSEVECIPGSATGFDLAADKRIKGPAWGRDLNFGNMGQIWRQPYHYGTLTLVDLDQDGSDDICGLTPDGVQCFRGGPGGFDLAHPIQGPAWLPVEPQPPIGTPQTPRTDWAKPEHYSTISFADVTGDGLPDICGRDADGIICYRGLGTSFDLAHPFRGPDWSGTSTPQPPPPPPTIPPTPTPTPVAQNGWDKEGYWRSIVFVDINGDGKADVCGRGTAGYVCHLSTGAGFGPEIAGPKIADNFEGDWMDREYYQTLRFTDVDGDGRPEICARGLKGLRCWHNKSGFADLLTKVSNALGGSTEIDYVPAAVTSGSRMPYPMAVVNALRTSDGRGNGGAVHFDYKGGFFHQPSLSFRGFARVSETSTDAHGTALSVKRHLFAQATATRASEKDDLNAASAPTKGRTLQIELGKPTGVQGEVSTKDRELTRYVYAVVNDGPRQRVDLARREVSACYAGVCDPDPHATEYDHDRSYVTAVREFGLANDPKDNFTRKYIYNWDPAGGPEARLRFIETYEGIETVKLRERREFVYDQSNGCDPALAGQAAPVWGRGLLSYTHRTGGTLQDFSMADFDEFGNVVCAFTPQKGKVTTTFDPVAKAFAVASTDALGHRIQSEFAGVGGVPDTGNYGATVKLVGPNGSTTSYKLDPFGRVVERQVDHEGVQKTEYLDEGLPLTQRTRSTSPSGLWEETNIDGLGRPWQTRHAGVDGTAIVSETRYNSRSLKEAVELPHSEGSSAEASTFQYDYVGRPILEVGVNGEKVVRCYIGRTMETISPGGKRVDRSLDQLGRLRRVTVFEGVASQCSPAGGLNGHVTQFDYDPFGGLANVSDGVRQISFTFDTFGRNKTVTDSFLGVTTSVYDPVRGVLSELDRADGTRVTYAYDVTGRLTHKTTSGAGGAKTETGYVYDGSIEGNGKLTSIIDSAATTSFQYRLGGALISTLRTIGDHTYVINRHYDADGNLDRLVYPDGYALTYSQVNGHLTSIEDAGGAIVTFDGIDALGRPAKLHYRNGVEERYVYGGQDQKWCAKLDLYVCGVDVVRSATNENLLSVRRDIDPERRTTQSMDSRLGQFNYTRDEFSRLSGATSAKFSASYRYDDSDNVVGPVAAPYTYQGGTARLTAAQGRTFRYDAGGRLKSILRNGSEVRSIQYDLAGRPHRLEDDQGAVALNYDDNGDLTYVSAGGQATDVVDGIAECVGSQCHDLLFLNGTLAAVTSDHGTKLNYYHWDLSRSTRLVTNGSGQVLAHSDFGPYGERVGNQPTDPSGLVLARGYLGAPHLPGSNYELLGPRLYDPQLQRFLEPDPANAGQEVLRRANPYAYGFDDPVVYQDPDGQCPVCVVIAIGAVFGAYEANQNHQNILEGALRGALIAGAGYYAGGIIGGWLDNATAGAILGQAVVSGADAAISGGDFGDGFAHGALAGAIGAGVGEGTMEIIPVPETETAAGALGRQATRDFIRGAAKSVILAKIAGDPDPFSHAFEGGLMETSRGFVATAATGAIATALSDGKIKWVNHSYWVEVENVPFGAGALRVGLFTLANQDHYQAVTTISEFGRSPEGRGYLAHEDTHGQQYNVYGTNFIPAYLASALLTARTWSDLSSQKEGDLPWVHEHAKMETDAISNENAANPNP